MWMIRNPFSKLQPKELKRWVVSVASVLPHAKVVTVNQGG